MPTPSSATTGPAAAPATVAPEAPADPADGNSGLADADYSRITDHLRRYVSYPYRARQQGWQGRVLVAVCLKPDGSLEKADVVASSGHSLLDESALQAIRRAAPFPAFGREIRKDIPVNYNLR
jgi:protein TonB